MMNGIHTFICSFETDLFIIPLQLYDDDRKRNGSMEIVINLIDIDFISFFQFNQN